MLAVALVIVASLIGSGVLFRHQRVTTYLGAAGALFEAQWLLLTLIGRGVADGSFARFVFLCGGALFVIAWAVGYRHWSFPYRTAQRSGLRDVPVLLVLLLVVGAAALVARANGFQGDAWITHGFYNGDTATFVSLVQKSLLTNGLVHANPFAGNGALEYPTLLHGAVASLLEQFGVGLDWLHFLSLFTYVQLVLTIPLFFLLWDIVFPEPDESWRLWFGVPSRVVILAVQACIVVYVLGVSWDGYIYPQSHFFLTGVYLLLGAVLLRAYAMRGLGELVFFGVASCTGLVLLFSNAVVGTAALVAVTVFHIARALDRRRAVAQRALYFFGVPVWGVLFLIASPGAPSFTILPSFSYTTAGAMVLAIPFMTFLLVSLFLSLDRQPLLASWVVALGGAAFVTFVFSSRNIVVENASRFFYQGFLLGFPLMLHPLLRGFYWVRRELVYSSRSLLELLIGWGAVVAGVGLVLLPMGASMASAHDNLMFKDEQVVSFDNRALLWWIEEATTPDARFLVPPASPFSIPVFTGRSLVRSDYWLSPRDSLAQDVFGAFSGDLDAQERAVAAADYLFVPVGTADTWDVSAFQKVFAGPSGSLYRL